jgi:hypothetical protein
MKPRIYIYVEGGIIQSIIADQPVDLLVLDGDVEGDEDEKEWKDYPDGDPFTARKAWAEVDVSRKCVNHMFNQDDLYRVKNAKKKDLPTLIGQLKDEDAIKLLEKRLKKGA